MTSQQQQQQTFNASMAFQNNNNAGGDGWDDWDWNDNSSGQSGQQQQHNSPNVNYNQPPQQQQQQQQQANMNYNNYNSYQQSMQYQTPPQQTYYQPSQQNPYQNQAVPPPQQQYQQTFTGMAPPNMPPPSDPNQNFNWNLHANFCVSPTTSTEVQHGHSRSTSNCSSEMIRTETINPYEDPSKQVLQSIDSLQNHHQNQNQTSRIPDARNNTPQMPPHVKQNPQMARIMKSDGLSPQWSVESQVSQTSSERSNESGELDSRSSATVTSDEGGFYQHHHHQHQQPQQFIEQKADVVQEVRNVSEHSVPPTQAAADPNMDKLDQALFEMNVFQNQTPGQVKSGQEPVSKESSLPPPPMIGTGNQPNFNQVVKLPSHTPSPPPAFNPNPVNTSVSSPGPVLEPPKKSTPPLANLPPPPMAADKRGVNPYKRTGQAHHHNLNFQAPAVKLPAVMPTVFHQDGSSLQETGPSEPKIPEQASLEQQQRPNEVIGFGNDTQNVSLGLDTVHARGRGSLPNQGHPSPRRDLYPADVTSHVDPYRPIDPSFGRNQVQYNMPQQQQQPERGQNQAIGQEIFNDERRRTDSDRSQPSPHTPMTHHSPAAPIHNISIPDPEPITQDVSVRNDRNEYLQTGHLSEDNYNSPGANRTPDLHETRAPPPGMSRFVLGQPENDISNNQEPPPGLDRMIPGTDLENTQLDMAREADGQVSDSSTVPPNRNYSAQRNVSGGNIEITDRNLYTVPGESGARSSTTRRIVPGNEDNRSPGTTTITTPPQQQNIQVTEQAIPEQERELAVDGENLQDQQIQRQNEITREDPIEGADTLDEAASTPLTKDKGDTESNLTTETGRKETSTNEDSDRGVYYRSGKKGNPEEGNRSKAPQRSKGKDDYYSDSDYSESERHRYREGSVREGSVNKGDRGTLGRRKDDKERDRRERKHKEDRNDRYERDRKDRYDPDESKYHRRRRGDPDREYYDRDDYKNSLRRRREKVRDPDDDEYAKSDREHRDRRHRRDKYYQDDDEYLKSDRERKRKDRDDKDDRRRKDERYDRDRRDRDRRRNERGGRYDEDYDQQRRTGTKSGRSNRDDPRYAANYYQQPGYDYNALAYYQQHQQYFEHLRRTNPQAYAEWYNRLFYAQSQAPSQRDAATTDGRESVHSGRSSVNENRYNRPIQQFYDPNYHRQQMNQSQNSIALMDQSITSIDYNQPPIVPSGWNSIGPASIQDHSYYMNNDNSYYQPRVDTTASGVENPVIEEQLPQRMTPSKYTMSHSTASLSHGLLVSVKPRYSVNGFNDVVKIFSLTLNDSTRRLFSLYPGPLQRASTHKKSVIEFCEEQIRLGPFSSATIKSRGNSMSSISSANQANRASYTLLWNYLILLLRQNGSCIGTDISELLMRNKIDFPFETPQVKSSNGSGRDSALSDIKEKSRDSSPEAKRHEEDEGLDEQHRSFDDEEDESKNNNKKVLTEVEVTEKFRNYLIYGNLDEALEWATENNLWGHALFLASKVNRRQHANVMMKFANKLPLNDPLQTLYQLMSGRTPYSVSCFADEKWGDWRPHLAMIMSNEQERAELNRKSITVLGDSLYNRGDYFAAQFCYLLAGVPFGKYPDVNQESTLIPNSQSAVRLVLLGTSQHKTFKEFAINEAIIMTEIYEYARSLYIEEFSIVELQMYKYLLATRILDYGMQLKSLLYMEQISKTILKYPSKFEPKFIERVYTLADRLKYYDPVMEKALDENYGAANVEDQKWLQDLREILNQYNLGALTYDQQSRDVSFMANTPLPSLTVPPQTQVSPLIETVPTNQVDKEFNEINQQFSQLNLQYQQVTNDTQVQQQQQSYYSGETPAVQTEVTNTNSLGPRYSQGNVQELVQDPTSYNQTQSNEYQANESQYNSYNQQQQQQDQVDQSNYYGGGYTGYDQQQSMGYDSMQQQNSYDYYGQQSIGATDETPRPSITMPGTNSNKSAYYDSDTAQGSQEQKAGGLAQDQNKNKGPAPKDTIGKPGNANQGSGWFGGIFNKLSLKPKNQMKLPDDKNPSIVWDPDKKRWVNTEGGEDEQESFKPPPKMSDLMPSMQQQQQQVPTMPTPAAAPQPPSIPMMDQVPNAATVPTISNGPTMTSQQPEKTNAEPAPTPRLQSNMYKMQRNRTLKKSYVDVFNPSGAPMSKPSEPILAPAMPQAATPQSGFFVPGQPSGGSEPQQQANGVPQFYDPNQFSSYQQ